MFYSKYLNSDELEELLQNYDIDYLKSVDEDNFYKVYELLKKYNFDYIQDIILKYLDIFMVKDTIVEKKINNLIKILGNDYLDIIAGDMSYLEYIVTN